MKQWEEKTAVNFFSIYFIQNNEEIHFSFKNSEKQCTQALKFLIWHCKKDAKPQLESFWEKLLQCRALIFYDPDSR